MRLFLAVFLLFALAGCGFFGKYLLHSFDIPAVLPDSTGYIPYSDIWCEITFGIPVEESR